MYISAPATSASTIVQRFTSCVDRIDAWMSSNRLRMNADKTQLLWLGTRQQLNKLSVNELQLLGVRVSLSVTNLGVTIDSQLSMYDHVASLCRACFYQLRQLRQVRSSLTVETTKTLIHITPILRELHWLPVRKRTVYKLAVMVYKCLHGLAPPYLAVDCVPVTSLPSRRYLRSAESGCLAVTGTTTTLGSRNFAVTGAKVWNSLPVDLRLLSRSLRTFGHKLKHYLFLSEP